MEDFVDFNDDFADFNALDNSADHILLAMLSGGSNLSANLLATRAYAVALAMRAESERIFMVMGEEEEETIELGGLPSWWKNEVK